MKEEDKLEDEESVGLVAYMNGNYFWRNYVWKLYCRKCNAEQSSRLGILFGGSEIERAGTPGNGLY